MTRWLRLTAVSLALTGCVGQWGPDLPAVYVPPIAPVVVPPPVVVAPPVIVVPVIPRPYYYRPYYRPYQYWRR